MKTPCRYPGCRALLDKSGYCDEHKASAPKRHSVYDRHVRSKDPALAMAARIRSSERWRKVRRSQLSGHPLCQDPFGEHKRRNTTETATQVHHVIGLIDRPELAFHASNLMSVCTACHARLEREHRKAVAGDPRPSSRKPGPPSDGPCFG